jgi:predicted RND superfamily exporter protein
VTKELRKEKAAERTPKERMPKERMRKTTKKEAKPHVVGEEPKEEPEVLEVMRKEEALVEKRKATKKEMSAADLAKDSDVEAAGVVVVEEEKEGLAEVKAKRVNGLP